MTHTDAEELAVRVAGARGHAVRVEYEDEESGFVVLVSVAHPRSEALKQEFRLGDELDWEWLRDRIISADL